MTRSLARRRLVGRLATVVALSVVVALGGAATAFAGLPPLTPITPIFPPWSSGGVTSSLPATVTGVVTATGGAPLAGVRVQIFGHTDSSAIEAQSFSQTATTGPTGQFVIPDVIQGKYEMVINDQGASPSIPAYRESYPWYDWASWGDGGADTRHDVIGGTTVNVGTIALSLNGHVTGRAMIGGTPVANSEVIADIVNGGERYSRRLFTGADGRFDIANAPAGQWTLTYSGSGTAVPFDGGPPAIHSYDAPIATESEPITFTLAAGATNALGTHAFLNGAEVQSNNWETYNSNSYQLSNIGVALTSEADASDVYYWSTDETGHATRVVMPGSYTMAYHDSAGLYLDHTVGPFVAAGGASTYQPSQLSPAPDTYAVHGHITESGTGSNVQSWVTAAYVDPSAYASWTLRVLSNGTGTGLYLVRLPAVTGLPGNQVRLEFNDKTGEIWPGTNHPDGPNHIPATFTVTGPSDVLHDVSVVPGGRITGTVHDETGAAVVGVGVSAERLVYNPEADAVTWMNSALPSSGSWFTLTDSSGNYTLGGLPTGSDYRVVFNPDYNPAPWPLPIKYRAYYRRVYHSRPVVDSLAASTTPIAVEHDPVTVSLGATHSGIDETITPGGYVGLHADGPAYPTGAVYSDVMYRVGSAWAEVDSGFSTGGTFEKLWKVLPVGHYRLDYSDYFGRGAGSWEFDLAAGEHKYASVIVPMPMTPMSFSTGVSGSFDGLLNGGLPGGGAAGSQLNVLKMPSLPTTAPPPPPNYIPSGGIFDVSLVGATADGVWTLTLPYDPAVPDSVVGGLRVRHLKADGTAEILVPFRWNTINHTVQVQTASLSPFQMMYNKTKVSLGRPSVPSRVRRNKRFTATGILTPKHTAGAKSVRLYVYKYSSSKRRYVLVSKLWTKNYTYRSTTRWAVSLRLGKGKYRLTPVAPADAWHLSTTGAYKSITIK